jgi:hypothetical protein
MTTLDLGNRPAVGVERGSGRLFYIDNIRSTIIILVLSMHACDTYSPFGSWYFTDRAPTGAATTLTFGIYQSFLQAFFMSFLFSLSGYQGDCACRPPGGVAERLTFHSTIEQLPACRRYPAARSGSQ